MDPIYVIILFCIALLFASLWFKEKYSGDDLRSTIEVVKKRLSSIDDKLSALRPGATPEQASAETAETDGPVTKESVYEALRYHHLTIEEEDPDEPETVHFTYHKVRYRVNTAKLPYLSMEVPFNFDSKKEDVDLMMQVAQYITCRMYIAKILVLPKEEVYVYQVDLIADTYLPFRNNLRNYLDLLIDAQHRFVDQYHRKREEQKQLSNEALQTTLLAAQSDAAGNIMPS